MEGSPPSPRGPSIPSILIDDWALGRLSDTPSLDLHQSRPVKMGLKGSDGTLLRWLLPQGECERPFPQAEPFFLVSPRTVSSSGAQSHALTLAPRGQCHDFELPDKAASAEVSHPSPLLLLQGGPDRAWPGPVPRAAGPCSLRGPLRVLLVRGCYRGQPCVEKEPPAGDQGTG